MLSDEEKKTIANLKTEYEKLIKQDNILFPLYKSNAKRLINLIEKQQKEIEELKDKIKAKIEECREILYSFEKELELKANKDKFIHKESMNCLLGQISILQSLLEEE